MWFKPKTDAQPSPPPGWNIPPARLNTSGEPAPWVRKGGSAPAPLQATEDHGNLAFPQRFSERVAAFSPRLPIQGWLRERRTVLVTPLEVDANALGAPGGPNRINFGAADDAGWTTRQNEADGHGGIGGFSESASRMGMYLRDYSLQTYQARATVGQVFSPPTFQNSQAINDITAQVEMNGVYSNMNANLAAQYLNLRAPTPWEGLGGC